MRNEMIRIAGVGCALADFLYTKVDFKSPGFSKYISVNSGDGGLSPGKLVFTEELQKFANKPYSEILKDIIGENLSITLILVVRHWYRSFMQLKYCLGMNSKQVFMVVQGMIKPEN
jgi:hypothetical protein